MKITASQSEFTIVGLIVSLVYYVSPFHNFQLWSQVLILQGSTLQFENLFSQAHFLRFLLVLPTFLISDYFNLSYDFVFSILCFVMVMLIIINCKNIFLFFEKKGRNITLIYITVTFIAISAFMNGRVLFAFLGFSFLILSICRWENHCIGNANLIVRLLISLFLCSVSSGTFLSTILAIIFWSSIYFKRRKGKLSVYLVIMLGAVSPIIFLYIAKNVNFYGGGIKGVFNMMNHGIGRVFYTLDLFSLCMLTFIVWLAFLGFMMVIKYQNKTKLLHLFIGTSGLAGLFGYSTLSLMFIPLNLIILVHITRGIRIGIAK